MGIKLPLQAKKKKNISDCTRLVHRVISFPVAFCSVSASLWLCATMLAAAVFESGLPPRAAVSCASRSAMRWFSFSSRTFPSWASSSQCSFSCSRRAIFSWLCCTCVRPAGSGKERTMSLWEEDWVEVWRGDRAAVFREKQESYNKSVCNVMKMKANFILYTSASNRIYTDSPVAPLNSSHPVPEEKLSAIYLKYRMTLLQKFTSKHAASVFCFPHKLT